MLQTPLIFYKVLQENDSLIPPRGANLHLHKERPGRQEQLLKAISILTGKYFF